MDNINENYLDEETMKQVKEAFDSDAVLPSIALAEFLTEEALLEVRKELRRGWQPDWQPDKHRYAMHARIEMQEHIAGYVKSLTGKKPLQEENKSFRHRDYTILHDEEKQPAGFLAYLFLEDWNEEWGGNVVFMKDGEMLGRFTPSKNTLVIVRRKQGVKMFVQYVNHHAGRKSFTMVSA